MSLKGKVALSVLMLSLILMFASGLRGAPVDSPGMPQPNNRAADPGVRGGPPGAGSPIAGLTTSQLAFFSAGQGDFNEIDSVTGSIAGTGKGLGPSIQCRGVWPVSCSTFDRRHKSGWSTTVTIANDQGASNRVPSFITSNGPVREGRFPLTFSGQVDGGVHALFTITGRSDAAGCSIRQDDFARAASLGDLIFRIPTPVFGDGLIEAFISDAAILANQGSSRQQKRNLGINGRPNSSGNDGTITRFGWKAQNKSMEIFSGEAYNVEVGVTNELFNTERDQTAGCQFNATPEDSRTSTTMAQSSPATSASLPCS